MIKSLIIVGSGSFAGGALRYLLSHYMKSICTTNFPWATLTVNLLGCFLIGLIFGLVLRWGSPAGNWCLLLTTGFCGGFTTFSTFSHESLQMLQNGNYLGVIGHAGGSIVIGIALVALGHWIAR